LIDAWEKAASFNPDGVFVESDQITNALHAVERVGSPPLSLEEGRACFRILGG
jgi:hypothetical protein